jgi:transcription-repair coupling factor (superfamily II helicase)
METPRPLEPADQATTPAAASPWPLGPVLAEALATLDAEGRAGLSGVEGAARAFALARLWLARPQTWLVVCPTLPAAEALARDLEFLLAGWDQGQGPVRLFPAYEFSPYQDMEPPPEVRGRRLAVLWELVCAERPLVVVTSSRGATSRLCPPEHLVDQALELRPGLSLEREALVEALIQIGRAHV